MVTVEKHFKDQEHLNAAKALHRTVAVHQLIRQMHNSQKPGGVLEMLLTV
jgi:hypothetical protein